MLLPWSTVKEISVTEFPFSKMIEYQISADKMDEFDFQIRRLVKILKETKYPYPLEGNRGFLGAYGKMTLVWFYDSATNFKGYNNLLEWVKKYDREIELHTVLSKINEITKSSYTYNLTYKKDLSY
ncbi:hypothetical protein [Chondrinema litorale]|uniref:hypothetical protein n=1 Tax=Chondrinema litorale TaxID=2994555 RepID=UPI002543DC6D|nr:hypothetical protein [Chondrinema litorale]UZR98505.1 hypothetical protein OQ292_31355 [Chondrinema litorale]